MSVSRVRHRPLYVGAPGLASAFSARCRFDGGTRQAPPRHEVHQAIGALVASAVLRSGWWSRYSAFMLAAPSPGLLVGGNTLDCAGGVFDLGRRATATPAAAKRCTQIKRGRVMGGNYIALDRETSITYVLMTLLSSELHAYVIRQRSETHLPVNCG